MADRAKMDARDLANAPSKLSRTIADAAYPGGAHLRCAKCGWSFAATRGRVAKYFQNGWPEHCGQTMTAETITRAGSEANNG